VQTIVSREIAPATPAVVTIGRITGGTVRNIIASSVEMNGSVRTLEPGLSATIEAAVRRMLDGLKTSLRVDYTLDWTKLAPVLRNDPAILNQVIDAARHLLGAERVVELTQSNMGSEDYAWFAERIPSAHLMIGSAIPGHATSIHRADYRLNEDVIPVGVRVIAAAVLELMRRASMSPRPTPAEKR
jgi:hippurate hydrolase